MHRNTLYLAAAFAGFAVASAQYEHSLRKKNRELTQMVIILSKQTELLCKQVDYMCDLLADHGIAPTEFDMIALMNPDLM